MLGKAAFVLGLSVALALALADQVGEDDAPDLLSGAGAGLVCALTAVGGALWVQARQVPMRHGLLVVVAGMLGRMALLGAWAGIAFSAFETEGLPFLGGFAVTYLAGQAVEIWVLSRRTAGRDAPPPGSDQA